MKFFGRAYPKLKFWSCHWSCIIAAPMKPASEVSVANWWMITVCGRYILCIMTHECMAPWGQSQWTVCWHSFQERKRVINVQQKLSSLTQDFYDSFYINKKLTISCILHKERLIYCGKYLCSYWLAFWNRDEAPRFIASHHAAGKGALAGTILSTGGCSINGKER